MKKIVGLVVIFLVVFSLFMYVGSYMSQKNLLDDENTKLYNQTQEKFSVFVDNADENKGILEKLKDKLNPDENWIQALAFGFLYVLEFVTILFDIMYMIYSFPSFFMLIINVSHPLFLQLVNIITWILLLMIYFAIKKEISK
jgi:hypothetical protein